MKKPLIVFLMLLTPLIGFSQTTTLSSTQKESLKTDTVKAVALLLAEHQKLSIENPILKEKVKALEEQNLICEQSNNIKDQEIKIYEEKAASNVTEINKLKNKNKNILVGSSIGGIFLFIIGLLL